VLIRLEPEQVNDNWPVFKPILAESLPPGMAADQNAMTNILTSALMGDCVFWGHYRKQEKREPGDFAGLVVTSVNQSPVTKLKRLLVFSFWADDNTGRAEIVKGIRTLEEYARSKNCKSLYAVTENNKLEQVLDALGWNSNSTSIYKTL